MIDDLERAEIAGGSHGKEPKIMADTMTTDKTSPIAEAAACRFLRSKEMYIHVAEPDWHLSHSHSGIFWCTHTQNCLGPDGQTAEPTTCLTGRTCYQAV
jgi:hypothetical protein